MRLGVKTFFALSAMAALAVTTNASAQERFTFEKQGSGFIRFDHQTGAVDLCSIEKNTVKCTLNEDSRRTYEEEITRLKQQISALETSGEKEMNLPSKKDIDKTIDMMKYFMKEFRGITQDDQKDTPAPHDQL